jgi:2-hydroxy-6-oxonona-2,4-dienedioate hydrolase
VAGSTWQRVEGRPMYARVWPGPPEGAGLPIVLVHGLGVSSRYMVPTGLRLARTHRVYAPDLPGCGRSARPPHALNVTEQAAALAAWMTATGIPRAAFLGNSLGCQVIVALAERDPARVAGAVLVAPTMDPHAPHVWQQALRLLRDMPNEPLALWWIAGTDYLRAGPWRVLRTAQLALRDPLGPHLPAVGCPVLVVAGGRDPIVPVRWAAEVAAGLPQGRLVVLPAASHAANEACPAALVGVAEPFFRGLDGGR